MTKVEDKKILIQDLGARLVHGVICEVTYKDSAWKTDDMVLAGVFNDECYFTSDEGSIYSSEFKPYLRPLSSMTEEEQSVFSSKCELTTDANGEKVWAVKIEGYDWLNANHFDFRGLIPMGLALVAPEGMYESEE